MKLNTSLFSLCVVSLLAVMIGCGGDTTTPSETTASSDDTPVTGETSTTSEDSLADVLELVGEGNVDAAVETFLNQAPEDWVASTSLQAFDLSESDFARLSRNAKNDMQNRFIEHAGNIKKLSRAVIDRANQLNRDGDTEAAKAHIEAVQRLGEQLKNADIVLVLQQTGLALTGASLDE